MTNIKAFLGAAAITAVAAVPLYYADAAGRTERVAADLEKRTATVAWTWTDMTDHAVRLSLTRNGEDFPTAGWGGTLFIGDGALGCAVAGGADGYNELFFDVGREYVPTNGKYAVQIIATNGTGRVEEWARGTLTVRANPAADGMPTNWNTYADIARRVAPYIDAQGILSDPANADALWGAVSNRTDALIGAIAPKADLTDATNYTDAALGAFAVTGAVARAEAYGTPTRWTDATGCVWEVNTGWRIYTNGVVAAGWTAWNYPDDSVEDGIFWSLMIGLDEDAGSLAYAIANQTLPFGTTPQWDSELTTIYNGDVDYNGIMLGDSIRAVRGETNLVGRVALTNDIPNVSGYATQQQATNAAIAVADAKISTNNSAFVSAVLAAPLAGADAGDLAELSEYGSYGTMGAAILALIAGLAALKRRVASAETALAQKASLTDLPYALVTPGEWEFSDGLSHEISGPREAYDPGTKSYYWIYLSGAYYSQRFDSKELAISTLSISFENTSGDTFTATRASLPGHLLDRAVNAVSVSAETTLTLPALVNVGKARDFLVRLTISGSTVPTITFSPDGNESVTYETDGDEFPVPDEAGTWSYSFTENCVAHTFAVSLKKVNEVAAPQTQGGS